MVSPDEVRNAYRVILGREPENERVIAEQVKRHRTIAELGAALSGSAENQRASLLRRSFRGPATHHPTDPALAPILRLEARKIARRLARPKGWFQTRAAIRKRQRICGPGADFIFLQTCDPDRYFAIWAAGSQTVRRYCAKQGFGYEAYIGIKSGYFPWHATYNRIFLFKELWERKFRGWAIYIDADAVIDDQDFDLRAYTQDKSQFAAVLSYNGEAHWWQVNSGVMILNFAHPWTGQLVTKLFDLFLSYCQPHLGNAKSWEDLPHDQWLLSYLLIENEGRARRNIFLEAADFLNCGSLSERPPSLQRPFVRHVLQPHGSVAERTDTVAKFAQEILTRAVTAEA